MDNQEMLEATLAAALDLASKGEVRAVQNIQRLLKDPDNLRRMLESSPVAEPVEGSGLGGEMDAEEDEG
jgi:hypothetical protein